MASLKDPYSLPSFSLKNRIVRAIWASVWNLFFRTSPRSFHLWRIMLLRCFGADIHWSCAIYPNVNVWMPANLVCKNMVAIADGVEIYNPSKVILCSHAIISQGAYLCTASHDMNSTSFPLFSKPIFVDSYAWICAKASILPGVRVAQYSVVGLGSVLTKDTEPYGVYAGNPAKFIKYRESDSLDS